MEEKKFLTLSETLRHNFWKIKKSSDFHSSCFINSVYTVFIHNERNRIGIVYILHRLSRFFFFQFLNIGRFPFNRKVGFEFRQLPVARGTTFSKISKKRTTSQTIPKFSDPFSRKFSFYLTLLAEFLELLVEWFAFSRYDQLKVALYSIYLCIPVWSLEFFATSFEYRSIVFNLQL